MSHSELDRILVGRIRRGDAAAWDELIARYEGRLLAFVESRLENRSSAEDIVQEAFVGFLNSLPNYDVSRSLESYLFSITAHKLTDHLRREGRRPTVPLAPAASDSGSSWDIPAGQPGASTILRDRERRGLEEQALAASMGEIIARWRERGDWQKIQCVELLFVRGWANKHVAAAMDLSEQAVANHKFDFIAKLRKSVAERGMSEDVVGED